MCDFKLNLILPIFFLKQPVLDIELMLTSLSRCLCDSDQITIAWSTQFAASEQSKQ